MSIVEMTMRKWAQCSAVGSHHVVLRALIAGAEVAACRHQRHRRKEDSLHCNRQAPLLFYGSVDHNHARRLFALTKTVSDMLTNVNGNSIKQAIASFCLGVLLFWTLCKPVLGRRLLTLPRSDHWPLMGTKWYQRPQAQNDNLMPCRNIIIYLHLLHSEWCCCCCHNNNTV